MTEIRNCPSNSHVKLAAGAYTWNKAKDFMDMSTELKTGKEKER
jgi:hypothetical protein